MQAPLLCSNFLFLFIQNVFFRHYDIYFLFTYFIIYAIMTFGKEKTEVFFYA